MDAVWPRMMVWAAGGTGASGGEHTRGGRLRLLAGAGQVCRGELPRGLSPQELCPRRRAVTRTLPPPALPCPRC